MATVRGMVCLKMMIATVILAQSSQSKVNNANKEGKVAASNKGSKGVWGSCKPLCKKRCLPTCNFVCCIAPPYDVPMKTVKELEKQMAWTSTQKKSNIKKHPVQKKILSKTHAGNLKNDKAHQYKKLGGVCHASCQKACLPFCDFKCCVAAKKKLTQH